MTNQKSEIKQIQVFEFVDKRKKLIVDKQMKRFSFEFFIRCQKTFFESAGIWSGVHDIEYSLVPDAETARSDGRFNFTHIWGIIPSLPSKNKAPASVQPSTYV